MIPSFLFSTFSKYQAHIQQNPVQRYKKSKFSKQHAVLDTQSAYVPEFITKEKVKKRQLHTITFDETKCNIYMYDINNEILDKLHKKSLIKFICMCAFILNRTSRPVKEIDIVLVFSKQRKELPDKSSKISLSPPHVNSGLTIHMNRTNTSGAHVPFCMIYRLEEMEKVILHEMMHAWNIDFWYQPHHEEHFRNLFNIGDTGKGTRLSESYNDALACMFMVGVDVYKGQKGAMSSLEKFTELYEQRMHYTRLHVVDVAQRVIAYHEGDEMPEKSQWREDTHAFAYYVVKALIFLDMPAFDAFLERQGGFAIGDDQTKIDGFYEFLKEIVTVGKYERLKGMKNLSLRMMDMSGGAIKRPWMLQDGVKMKPILHCWKYLQKS
jgi:hypothetical protein